MKNIVFIFFISLLMEFCSAQKIIHESDRLSESNSNNPVDTSLLEFYRQYSSFTDPGEYAYLFANLPDSLPELCSLIKSQIIHPYSDLPKYRELIPQERWDEAFSYPGVKSILAGLVSYDSSGFVNDRKLEDRLVLGCNQNAILLASILKYKGIPARVRAGHATYIMPGFHISHTICEVWNENEMCWILVDPSMDMVNFSREKFDFSNELWLKLQNEEIDPNQYGIPRRYTGLVSIVAKVCTDLASILGTEYPIDKYSPILDDIFHNNQLISKQIETLNKISELMKSINSESLSDLQVIYNNNPDLQITKSFEQVSKNSDNSEKAGNN
jgi:hypothetical protein